MDLLTRIIARDRAALPSPLVYGAVGDAYGFGLEFAAPDVVAEHNRLEYLGNAYWRSQPGRYSDDTQMQLVLAEALLDDLPWTPQALAQAFVDGFQRDPRPGYARRFYALLKDVKDGAEMLGRIQAGIVRPGSGSERNGAAMRAPVLGLLPDTEQVIAKAGVQARITHDSPGGVDSAVAAALTSHYFAHKLGPKAGLADYLDQQVPGHDWHSDWTGEVPCHGIKTMQAVVSALRATGSMADLLRTCVAFTGDVDSVATIALACASACGEFERNLPERLWTGLEDGPYGLSHLLEIEDRLLAALGF